MSESEEYTNCVISFGCPPNKFVDAYSTIAVKYFEKLREFADAQDGSVLIPGDKFFRWKPNHKGETLALANDDLILYHTNWNPPSSTVEEEEKVDEDES